MPDLQGNTRPVSPSWWTLPVLYYGNDRMMQKIDPELAERFRLACPEWAKHILNSDGKECPDMCFFADGKTWNILDGTSCMVGEAHGRRNDYVTGETMQSCEECMTFCIDLAFVLETGWSTVLERFLNHYEKDHKPEMSA